MTAPAGVFVYGSCVSRDTVGVLDADRYRLLAYVARQSLISAFAPPATLPAPATLTTFRRRMVEGDLASNLPAVLRRVARRVDVLLWDLVDERLGVYELDDGAVLTRGSDVVGTPLDEAAAAAGQHLPLGSDRHRELWSAALARWADLLAETGLTERVLLLAPPWARYGDDGTPVGPSFGVTPDEANARYAPYVADARRLGVAVAQVPAEQALTTPGHRWGTAPFHYSDAVYRILTGAVDAHLAAHPPPPRPHPHAAADPGRWNADALHRVTGEGTVLDLLVVGGPVRPDPGWAALPVFFCGAMSTREGRPGPFFEGLRISRELAVPAVLVADTGLTQHDDLGLAWYTGCAEQPLGPLLNRTLTRLREQAGRPLLLVGGSGGGFAALRAAADLAARGDDVTVLCWNPQTDLLGYDPQAVRAYLRSCFPDLPTHDPADPAARAVLRELLAGQGIRTRAVDGFDPSTPVLYLQSVQDWHVGAHLEPFATALGLEHDVDGWAGGRVRVTLGDFGPGHAAPGRDLVRTAVLALARGLSVDLAADLLRSAFPAPFAPARAGRAFVDQPTFEAVPDGSGGAVVRAVLAEPTGGWLTFAYYVLAGDERLAVRWYTEDPAFAVPADLAAVATSLTCFVRDATGAQRMVTVALPARAAR